MHNFIIANKNTGEEFVVLTIEMGYPDSDEAEGEQTNYLLASLKTGELSYEYSQPEFKNKYKFKRLVGSELEENKNEN